MESGEEEEVSLREFLDDACVLPPDVEKKEKEVWLQQQRQLWFHAYQRRLKLGKEDDGSTSAAPPLPSEFAIEALEKEEWLRARRAEWHAACRRRAALDSQSGPDLPDWTDEQLEEHLKKEWLRQCRAEHAMAMARRNSLGQTESKDMAPFVDPALLSTPTEREAYLRALKLDRLAAMRSRRQLELVASSRPHVDLASPAAAAVDGEEGFRCAAAAAASDPSCDGACGRGGGSGSAGSVAAATSASISGTMRAAAHRLGVTLQQMEPRPTAGGAVLIRPRSPSRSPRDPRPASRSAERAEALLLQELEALEASQVHGQQQRPASRPGSAPQHQRLTALAPGLGRWPAGGAAGFLGVHVNQGGGSDELYSSCGEASRHVSVAAFGEMRPGSAAGRDGRGDADGAGAEGTPLLVRAATAAVSARGTADGAEGDDASPRRRPPCLGFGPGTGLGSPGDSSSQTQSPISPRGTSCIHLEDITFLKMR